MPELAVELIDIISDHILIDNHTPTLKACTLSFSHLTRRFQRVLCSRKPVILSFYPEMRKNTGEHWRITSLLRILGEDPGFGVCLGEVRLYFKSMDESLLGDPRISRILQHCTDVHTLTVKLKTGSGRWSDIPDQNRIAIEQIVHSPSLKSLFISPFVVPWAFLLAPIANLEKLTLKSTDGLTEETDWLDFSANSPPATPYIGTAVQTLKAAPLPASRLAKIKSLTDPTKSAIDFGALRTLSTLCLHATNDVPLLREVLGQVHNLENLVISCFCSFFAFFGLWLIDVIADATINGLFCPPHAPSFRNLQTIEFTYKFRHVDLSEFLCISNELRLFPPNNSLKVIKLGEVKYHTFSIQNWKKQETDWRNLFAPFTKSAFPSLESFQIGITATLINGYWHWDQLVGATERIRELERELEGAKENQHFGLELRLRTRHLSGYW